MLHCNLGSILSQSGNYHQRLLIRSKCSSVYFVVLPIKWWFWIFNIFLDYGNLQHVRWKFDLKRCFSPQKGPLLSLWPRILMSSYKWLCNNEISDEFGLAARVVPFTFVLNFPDFESTPDMFLLLGLQILIRIWFDGT